jgi:hypothetical protein
VVFFRAATDRTDSRLRNASKWDRRMDRNSSVVSRRKSNTRVSKVTLAIVIVYPGRFVGSRTALATELGSGSRCVSCAVFRLPSEGLGWNSSREYPAKTELLADGGRADGSQEADDTVVADGQSGRPVSLRRRGSPGEGCRRRSHSSQHVHHNWKSALHQPRGRLQKPAPPSRTCLSTHNQRAWMVGRLRNEPGHLPKEGGRGPGADLPCTAIPGCIDPFGAWESSIRSAPTSCNGDARAAAIQLPDRPPQRGHGRRVILQEVYPGLEASLAAVWTVATRKPR